MEEGRIGSKDVEIDFDPVLCRICVERFLESLRSSYCVYLYTNRRFFLSQSISEPGSRWKHLNSDKGFYFIPIVGCVTSCTR